MLISKLKYNKST